MRKFLITAAFLMLTGPAFAESSSDGRTDWSGLYVGAHVGYGQGDASTKDDLKDWCVPGDTACIKKFVGPFNFDVDGAFGGGTIGYNYQIGSLLLGVEADLGYLNIEGTKKISSSVGSPKYQLLEVEGGFYALLGGRVGFISGNALFYGKGGYVYWDADATQTTTTPGFTTHGTGALDGYAVGGGVEYGLGQGWSVKGEYLRMGFNEADGNQTRDDDGYTFGNHTKIDSIDTFKAGINYRFK